MPCENNVNSNVQCTISNESHPMLNLQIGGLVTTMEKSFLQDTSPPSFLCSMDNSINSLSNSLVTSADFTNISFLQSPNSLYMSGGGDGRGRGGGDGVADQQEQRRHQFNITNGITMGRSTVNDYTLTEMLRDRKILESLFISNDGTFIKDSHIGQIDDISLALSKTASSCSTIENSTGSDDDYADVDEQNYDANRTVIMCNNDHTFNKGSTEDDPNNIIDDDNLTYNLRENQIKMKQPLNHNGNDVDVNNVNQQETTQKLININVLEKVNKSMNSNTNKDNSTNDIEMNKTFDYSHINNVTPNDALSPVDNIDKNQLKKFCESTPVASSVRYTKQNYASNLHTIVDTNISPITQIMSPLSSLSQQLNVTYEQLEQQPPNQHQHNATYIFNNSNNGTTFNDHNINNDDKNEEKNTRIERIERIERMTAVESPNLEKEKLSDTYNNGIITSSPSTPTTITMQDNVMNSDLHLSEIGIEANLLTSSKNEEEFDHMLDKFGKIQLNSEQLIKMKKSLDSLKKRFNYNTTIKQSNISSSVNATVTSDVNEGGIASQNFNDNITRDLSETQSQSESRSNRSNSFNDQENFDKDINNIMDIQNNPNNANSLDLNKMSPIKLPKDPNVLSGNMIINANTNASGSSGGDRLLSRRSRLYDDINLAAISSASGATSTSAGNATMTAVTALGTQISKHSTGVVMGGRNATSGTSSTLASSSFTINNEEQQKIESPIADRVLDRKDLNLNKSSSSSSSSSLTAPYICTNDKPIEKLHNDRDRDRFKTIVISKNKIIGGNDHIVNVDDQVIPNEFNNVPCDLDCTVDTPAAINSFDIAPEVTERPDIESNMETNPDRFRTIKIKNKKRFPDKPLFNVPCINDNVDNNQCNNGREKPLVGECILTERYSRRDQIESNTNASATASATACASASTMQNNDSNSSHLNRNYFTYKKQKLNAGDTEENLLKSKANIAPTNISKYNVRPEARTLSRPRFISGLKKLSAENKATSADELQKTTLPNVNRNFSNAQINETTKVHPSKNAHFHAGTITLINSSNLKSPMGVKSKSFHNLSSNSAMSRNATGAVVAGIGIGKTGQEKELSSKMHGLRKPSGIAIGGGNSNTLMKFRNPLQSTATASNGIQQQTSDDAIFKMPKQVSGIRAPAAVCEGGVPSVTATAGKRAGLVRPSSGFYSLNVVHKEGIQLQQSIKNCIDRNGNIGRHSSTDSMSSVSSKGSTHSLTNTQFGLKQSLGTIAVVANSSTAINTTISKPIKMQANLNLQQVTIASSGIPKPSGLRPPTSIKQRSSGLPRPSSYIRSEK